MPPPDFDELMGQVLAIGHEALTRVFASKAVSAATDPYLPWDKMRHKQPPRDLSLNEWWLATKFARRAIARELLFVTVSGDHFTYTLPDEILRLSEAISKRASGQIAISEQVTNAATRDRYIISSLIEEAITSSQLEGASTSRVVAKEMIRSGRSPRDKSERMILNNFNAMRLVGELRNTPLTPELVCEIHRVVTDGTLDDPSMAGRLQSSADPLDRVAVFSNAQQVVHIPPPASELPSRLAQLCVFANEEVSSTWIHPIIRALAIHFAVGYDHYFEDGNGRTARALFYWGMLKQGYWLTEFLSISRILKKAPSQYMNSFIMTEQDDGDLTYFLIYHARVIERAINDFDKYLAGKVAELRETRALLSATPGEYNYRQLAILESALKGSAPFYTVRSHAQSHNVSYETARQDLMDLERRDLLARRKLSRQFIWVPISDLGERIKSK